MPDVLSRHCAFCGDLVEGLNGPVEPVDPSKPRAEDPPGTGWHKHAGPSYGMGFPRMEIYCSDECLENRVIKKQEPTRLLLPFERTWTGQKPVRTPKRANARPRPQTKEAAVRRAELAEATLASAETRIEELTQENEAMAEQAARLEPLVEEMAGRWNATRHNEAVLSEEVERLEALVEHLKLRLTEETGPA